ncbi:hypothetical protein GR268_46775, partial [Rhizobium leguminosarum]|nr:hypothetical protein [Rhizobium leguminosarum]
EGNAIFFFLFQYDGRRYGRSAPRGTKAAAAKKKNEAGDDDDDDDDG